MNSHNNFKFQNDFVHKMISIFICTSNLKRTSKHKYNIKLQNDFKFKTLKWLKRPNTISNFINTYSRNNFKFQNDFVNTKWFQFPYVLRISSGLRNIIRYQISQALHQSLIPNGETTQTFTALSKVRDVIDYELWIRSAKNRNLVSGRSSPVYYYRS